MLKIERIRAVRMAFAFVIVAIIAVASPNASAELLVGDLISLENRNGFPGGAFGANDVNDGLANSTEFTTFCVELTQYVNFSTTYYVQDITYTSLGEGRSVTPQTQWLYKAFREADASLLEGITNFQNPTETQANALQLGIWQGMYGEYSNTQLASLAGWSSGQVSTYQAILSGWLDQFSPSALGLSDVKIMNLRTFTYVNSGYFDKELPDGRKIMFTGHAQDQLVYTPTPVPEEVTPELPSFYSTLSLAVMGAVAGIAVQLRKRCRAAATTA